MSILVRDPWLRPYFEGVACPDEVNVYTDDRDVLSSQPARAWIYDKLRLAESQGLECGTQHTPPARYPVFCKPRVNPGGLGQGGCIAVNDRDFAINCGMGDMWMKFLTGEHVSTDFAVVRGEPAWCRHTLGIPAAGGTFDYWIVEERSRPRLELHCGAWIRARLRDYTGMLNLESIGGRIISAHLRFASQWPDLYGRKWLDAMVRLHGRGRWDWVDTGRAEGYSIPLFGPHGSAFAHPPAAIADGLRATVGISSIHFPFDAGRPAATHAMPPGGFRLAVINSFNLAVGLRVRAALTREFALPGTTYRRLIS